MYDADLLNLLYFYYLSIKVNGSCLQNRSHRFLCRTLYKIIYVFPCLRFPCKWLKIAIILGCVISNISPRYQVYTVCDISNNECFLICVSMWVRVCTFRPTMNAISIATHIQSVRINFSLICPPSLSSLPSIRKGLTWWTSNYLPISSFLMLHTSWKSLHFSACNIETLGMYSAWGASLKAGNGNGTGDSISLTGITLIITYSLLMIITLCCFHFYVVLHRCGRKALLTRRECKQATSCTPPSLLSGQQRYLVWRLHILSVLWERDS